MRKMIIPLVIIAVILFIISVMLDGGKIAYYRTSIPLTDKQSTCMRQCEEVFNYYGGMQCKENCISNAY